MAVVVKQKNWYLEGERTAKNWKSSKGSLGKSSNKNLYIMREQKGKKQAKEIDQILGKAYVEEQKMNSRWVETESKQKNKGDELRRSMQIDGDH